VNGNNPLNSVSQSRGAPQSSPRPLCPYLFPLQNSTFEECLVNSMARFSLRFRFNQYERE
jgi:hypothetical protein